MENIEKPNQIFIFFISILLNFIFYYIVLKTGGTSYPFPHLYYIVILVVALFGNWINVMFTSILSSVLMSYWFMPHMVLGNIPQNHYSWIFRAMIFICVAIITKISTDKIRKKNQLLFKKSKELTKFQVWTFKSILELAESNDPETTGAHLQRMSSYAKVLMRDMDIPQWQKDYICDYIAFHDIGKVGIPDYILNKPGKLTEGEFQIMKKHTILGGEILEKIENSISNDEELKKAIIIAKELTYYHHERPDGKGYPFGLTGDKIPLAAKITALCDVYDALSTKRSYKEIFSHEECVRIIIDGKGTQFDEDIVDHFLKVEGEFKEIAEKLRDIEVNSIKNNKDLKMKDAIV